MDSTLIGQNTAEFMENLEKEFEEFESAKVVTVMTIVEIERDIEPEEKSETDTPDTTWSCFRFYSTDSKWSTRRGMVQAVVNGMDTED